MGILMIMQECCVFDLDFKLKGVQVVALINDNAKISTRFGKPDEGSFYLTWKND